MNGRNFGRDDRDPQRDMQRERDEHLVEINQLTKNVKESVLAINSSLDNQKDLISNISTGVAKTQKKMNFVTERLGTLLNTKGMLSRR